MIPKKQYLIFSHIMFEFILLNSCIIAVLLLKNPETTFLISDRIIDNVSIQLVMIYNIVWSAIVYFNGDKGFYTSQSVRKRFEFLTINIFLFIGMISTVAILFQVEIFNRTTFLLPIFVFSFLNFFLFSLLFEYYKMRNENPFNSNVLMIGADSRKFELEDFGKRIKSKGIEVIVFEPMIKSDIFFGSEVYSNIAKFKQKSSLIITNRMHQDLMDVKDKVFTRDLFGEN